MIGESMRISALLLLLFVALSSQECYKQDQNDDADMVYHRRQWNYQERLRLQNQNIALNCYGITDNLYSRYDDVIEINIFSSNIPEISKALFEKFRDVKRLSITGDNVINIHSNTFSYLPNLEYLNLANNKIEVLPKQLLTGNSLITLDLSHNKISSYQEMDLAQSNLKTLSLSSNELTDVAPLVTNCNQLTNLSFLHNKIEEIELYEPCLQLLYLDVAHNNISRFAVNTSKTFALLELDLSNNSLSISNDPFKYLQNLKRLDLSDNPLIYMPIDSLVRNTALEYLNLSNTKLETMRMGSFAKLEHLLILDLSYNKLSTLPKGIFHDLINLRKLYVNENHLTSLYTDNLKLSHINFNNNLWTCDVLADMIESLIVRHVEIASGSAHNTENVFGIRCTFYRDPSASTSNKSSSSSESKEHFLLLNKVLQNMQDLLLRQENRFSALTVEQHNQSNAYSSELGQQHKDFMKDIRQTFQKTMDYVGALFNSTQNMTKYVEVEQIQLQKDVMKEFLQQQHNISETIEKILKSITATAPERYHSLVNSSKTSTSPLLTEDTPLYAKLKISKEQSAVPNANYNFLIGGVYSIFFLLLIGAIAMFLLKFKLHRCRNKTNLEECNPLNSISI